MIYTERKVTMKNDVATIDSTIVLYRGDREIEILFTVVDHRFRFSNTQRNVINETQASYGQLAVALPDGTNLFTEITETNNGTVTFTITGEMIDEIHEVGFYSFHIRLYNEDKTSRITLPPVIKGIEIREPLVIEGDVEYTDLVGDATVGYSMVQTVGAEEEVFDEDGNYIKTNWQTGDKITSSKLNKIEEALENINNDIPSKTSELVNDSNFLTSVPSEYITETELNAKGYSTFNGDYNNLTNKPAIPSISGLASESYVNEYVENAIKDIPKEEVDLSNYAKKTELPTNLSQLTNDEGYITSIPNEYVTEAELNNKGYLTEHQDISNKADKTELHNHSNKSVLDGITSSKVSSWDNKSNFDGNYNSLTNKPNIPSIKGLATEKYVDEKLKNTTTNLPDYWKTRLDELGDKIDTLQMENGMDTLHFLWCSDIHGVPGTSPSNTTYIGEIGRYLMDKHNIPFFVVSGDIMSQASHVNTDSIWAEYDKLAPVLSPISNEEFLAIRGNHDGVWGSPTTYNGYENRYYHSYIGDKALFNAFMRRQTLDRYKRVFGKNGMYFYIDYHNYRIYLLNGHTFGDNSVNEQGQAIYNGFSHPILGSEQIQWVADTLMTVKEEQQVLFVCHAQLNQQLDYQVFSIMINHYIARTSGNASTTINQAFWGTAAEYAQIQVSFDFANAKGSILGWFDGHIHSDSIKTDLFDNIPIFTITTAGGDVRDTYYSDGTLTRTPGTATETALDLVTVTSDYIYFTRIGSGYDRKYNRLTKEVIIDNDSVVTPPEEPEVELTQGEITNEVTWTIGKRLSSAGDADKDATNSMASSHILVNPGDTINIYDISSLHGAALFVNLYKDESFVVNMPLSNADMNPTENNYAYAEYHGNGTYLTVQIKDIKSINSIRICCVTSTVTVFRNAEKVSNAIVLPEGTELYLNQRFSQSGGGLQANQGVFAVMIPIDGSTPHTFSVANLPNGNLNTTSTTLYTVDETRTVATGVNGVNYPCSMSTGITMSDDYKSAIINIPATASAHYLAFSFPIGSTREITELDLAGIVITLDEPYDGGKEITSEVTWRANSRLSSSSGDYSTLDGSYASTDISCSNGDVIRLYNVTQGTSYNYVTAYSSVYLGFIEVGYNDQEYSNAYTTATREDGVLTINAIHDNVKYIRVCSKGGIDPSTVRITKNMEL